MRAIGSVLAFLAASAFTGHGVVAAGTRPRTAPPTLVSLARDLDRVESVRDIKDLQRTFAQLAQVGRWPDMAALFAPDATLRWGNRTVRGGPRAVEAWLRADAGWMDGARPGSLDTLVADNPLVTLAADGRTARARWNGLRFMGDGIGHTRIQGGIYENEYVRLAAAPAAEANRSSSSATPAAWKIATLHYYPLYDGNYVDGWRIPAGGVPVVPYHFTPDDAGQPIPQAAAPPPSSSSSSPSSSSPPGAPTPQKLSTPALAARIARLNAEDAVRNLQHAYGYYVDRRMWADAAALFAPNATATFRSAAADATYLGPAGVRQALEDRMGPEGLARGVLNDRPLFDTVVRVDPDGRRAAARGIEIAMVGDQGRALASWGFSAFRSRFARDPDTGLWRFEALDVAPLLVANYRTGWGDGSPDLRSVAPASAVPDFLDLLPRAAARHSNPLLGPDHDGDDTTTSTSTPSRNLTRLQARLARSAAYDGAENASNAYGYYLDDLQCAPLARLHAARGHKLSPFAGWFRGPDRIAEACRVVYGTNRSARRTALSFHWRPQPVVLVSRDGRAASVRARLFQPFTSTTRPGAFNGAMYHDQVVLVDGNDSGDSNNSNNSNNSNGPVWKLWSVTIDEFYWQSANWVDGWSVAPNTSDAAAAGSNNSSSHNNSTLDARYPPDLALRDAGPREATFLGGAGTPIVWPDIQIMWFAYRNPVSGAAPEHYWPGCVPCHAGQRPDWALGANDYLEPPTGPTLVTATPSSGLTNNTSASNDSYNNNANGTTVVTVTVKAGPDEPVAGGSVELRGRPSSSSSSSLLRLSAPVPDSGTVLFHLPRDLSAGEHRITVAYTGNDRVEPGRTTLRVTI